MRDVLHVDRFEQADALFKPQRVEVLRRLDAPRSCTEVGVLLDQSPQRVYYHVKKLVDAELVEQVDERRVRGINEGIYQAAARSYWLSPHLLGSIGPRPVRDELSFGYLLQLVEDVQSDLARLGRSTSSPGRDDAAPSDLATLGVSGEITLAPENRAAFLSDLRQTLQELFTRHGGADGETVRLAVACYPKPDDTHPEKEHRS
ncbi:MAG: helix-turn-helix domain-containing protein [Tessaracoccus sp.]